MHRDALPARGGDRGGGVVDGAVQRRVADARCAVGGAAPGELDRHPGCAERFGHASAYATAGAGDDSDACRSGLGCAHGFSFIDSRRRVQSPPAQGG